MKLEVFKTIIESMEVQGAKSIEAAKVGVDLIEYEEGWILALTLALNAYYGKTGGDWIWWYLYERTASKPPLQAVDENNNPICYDITSLWKHVEELRVSENFEEYELPPNLLATESDMFKLLTGRS
jgi:hypothetical protein